MAQPLDQDVVNLAKAIRQAETGNRAVKGASGELASRYQYMPATWKSTAAKYLGDPNAPLTLENENKATYLKILDWKKAGYGPDQIASMWNSGKPDWRGNVGVNKAGVKYDTPSYVKKVGANYAKFKAQSPSIAPTSTPVSTAPALTARQQADQQSSSQYKPTFAANTTNPNPVVESLKFIGNIPSSIWGFAKNTMKAMNPYEIGKNVRSMAMEQTGLIQDTAAERKSKEEAARLENQIIQQYKTNKATGKDTSRLEAFMRQQGIDPTKIATPVPTPSAFTRGISEVPKAAYETLVPEAGRGLISAAGGAFTGNQEQIDLGLQTAQRALVNDPVGQIAPALLVGRGIAGKISPKAGAAIDTAVSKTAQTVIKPAKTVFGGAARAIAETTKFGIGQATGINPEGIGAIMKKPELYSKEAMSSIDRTSLGREVQSKLNKRAIELSETGKEYDPIRKSDTKITVPKNYVEKSITENTGLKFKNGKFTTSGEAAIRDAKDIRAVQTLFNTWKPSFNKGYLTANEFLNYRSDLAKLSKFEREISKSQSMEFSAKAMRANLNENFRNQLDGLKDLDSSFEVQKSELRSLAKGLVDKEGNLTDPAINRIANATGKGKDNLIARLEKVSPGITEKIKRLKTIEDIQAASGFKVGTYMRAAGMLGTGLVGGPLIAIIEAILTSPNVAVPILRATGLIKNSRAVSAVVESIKKGYNVLNNSPESAKAVLNKDVKDLKLPKMGLSIEDVTKTTPKKPTAFSPKVKNEYTYYHATPKSEAIIKNGFNQDTYVWPTKAQAEAYAKSQGKNWKVVEVKSTEKLKADNPKLTDDQKMDNGDLWLLKKENIKPVKPNGLGSLKVKTDQLIQEAKKYKSAEEFVKTSHELNIRDLVLDKGLLEKINRKSLTPDEPVKIGIRLDESNNRILRVLDGHHRIKEALDNGKTKIKVLFEGDATKSQLTDIWNKANKKSNFGTR